MNVLFVLQYSDFAVSAKGVPEESNLPEDKKGKKANLMYHPLWRTMKDGD